MLPTLALIQYQYVREPGQHIRLLKFNQFPEQLK